MKDDIAVGVVGDYDDTSTPHLATEKAVLHSARRLGLQPRVTWLATDGLDADPDRLHDFDALWCAPGSPYRSMTGALNAIRFARERHVPLLGTCGGFQHVVLEYARTVLSISDAQHAEYDPYASRLFITSLTCSLAGRTMRVFLEPTSRAAAAYDATEVSEQYYCAFGLNPEHRHRLDEAGLRVTGTDADDEARVVELHQHPFFIATLFVPQTASTPETPHPLISRLVRAAARAETAGAAP